MSEILVRARATYIMRTSSSNIESEEGGCERQACLLRSSNPECWYCRRSSSALSRITFPMPSPISGMSFDWFSQTDLHIAPMTTPTERAPQAIRTLINVSYTQLTLHPGPVPVHLTAMDLGCGDPPSEKLRVSLENKGLPPLFPPWSFFFAISHSTRIHASKSGFSRQGFDTRSCGRLTA